MNFMERMLLVLCAIHFSINQHIAPLHNLLARQHACVPALTLAGLKAHR